MLVRDEPVASILQEALEVYAAGRFDTQVEVKRFLESCPDFPRDTASGSVHNQRVYDILTRPIYAGYIAVPNWNVSLRKGQHDGLIDYQTFQKIQNRLHSGAKAPARKDISADFPLRGFVLCHDCEKPLTACWSKSKTGKKHPYYLCHSKGCASYRKSIRRDVIESEINDVLHALQPTPKLYELAKAMFRNAWAQRTEQAAVLQVRLEKELAALDKQIGDLVDRIVDASTPSVIAAYEKRIAKLEQDKALIAEKLENCSQPRHSFEELFELACEFLKNPWKLWDSGQLTLKRTVFRLAFSEQVSYCRKTGLRTPNLSMPFSMLADLEMGKIEMARPAGFEPATVGLEGR